MKWILLERKLLALLQLFLNEFWFCLRSRIINLSSLLRVDTTKKFESIICFVLTSDDTFSATMNCSTFSEESRKKGKNITSDQALIFILPRKKLWTSDRFFPFRTVFLFSWASWVIVLIFYSRLTQCFAEKPSPHLIERKFDDLKSIVSQRKINEILLS